MVRTLLIAVAIVSGLAACGEKPESPGQPPSAEQDGSLRPVQGAERPEITADRISKDVVGRAVAVPELSGAGPSDKWTFEADEYRRVEILEKHPTASGAELVVFVLTRSIPRQGDADVQVSGRLRLHYEWQGKEWVLRRVDNVNFRYTLGVAT